MAPNCPGNRPQFSACRDYSEPKAMDGKGKLMCNEHYAKYFTSIVGQLGLKTSTSLWSKFYD